VTRGDMPSYTGRHSCTASLHALLPLAAHTGHTARQAAGEPRAWLPLPSQVRRFIAQLLRSLSHSRRGRLQGLAARSRQPLAAAKPKHCTSIV